MVQKAAISATVMICAGSVADDRNMVACVRKTGEHKAMIDMEKRGQVQYAIEGNLVQRNYKVMKSGTQVAQVPPLQTFAGCYASQLASLPCFLFVTHILYAYLLYQVSAHHALCCMCCGVLCTHAIHHRLYYMRLMCRRRSCVMIMRVQQSPASIATAFK